MLSAMAAFPSHLACQLGGKLHRPPELSQRSQGASQVAFALGDRQELQGLLLQECHLFVGQELLVDEVVSAAEEPEENPNC